MATKQRAGCGDLETGKEKLRRFTGHKKPGLLCGGHVRD